MFLHRLRQLLSEFFLRLSGRQPSASNHPLERDSQLAAPAGHRQSTHTNTPASGLASGRWLDDTRRLRPRFTTTGRWAAHDRQTQAQPTRLIRPDTLPVTSSRPLDWAAGPSSSSSSSSSSTSNAGYEPTTPAPQTEHGATPPSGTEENQSIHQTGDRQLMALKYLVRLGIYNEGFASSSVPDQYQHSLGLDEPGNGAQMPDHPGADENAAG